MAVKQTKTIALRSYDTMYTRCAKLKQRNTCWPEAPAGIAVMRWCKGWWQSSSCCWWAAEQHRCRFQPMPFDETRSEARRLNAGTGTDWVTTDGGARTTLSSPPTSACTPCHLHSPSHLSFPSINQCVYHSSRRALSRHLALFLTLIIFPYWFMRVSLIFHQRK